MPIIYGLVARGSVVLAEYSPDTGNFTQIARQLLREVAKRPGADRRSYAAQQCVFHYIVDEQGLVVLCMADVDTGTRIPFAFLQDIQTRFLAQFGKSYLNASENSLDDAFARTLDQQMDYFNYSPEADEIRNIKNKLSEVMDVMVTNIDKVLERGEKIEVLVNQTNKLQTNSYRMRTGATKLKKRLWWKNVYLWVCIIFCCILLLLVVAAIIAVVLWRMGIFDKSSGSSSKTEGTTSGGAVLVREYEEEDLVTSIVRTLLN